MSIREKLLASTFYNHEKPLAICDTECFPNFWCIGFLRLSDNKVQVLEHTEDNPIDIERLRRIMEFYTIITYNGMSYDFPMIAAVCEGYNNTELKTCNDTIILGNVKYWEAEQALGVFIPKNWTQIDLIEPQPNAWASLKTLQGRLHGRKMQDLPYEPDQVLTREQMDHVVSYMGNDLEATANVLEALLEPLELRAALSNEYGINFRCKSDSQIGETIIKMRVEQMTGQRLSRPSHKTGTTFKFEAPKWLTFRNPELQDIAEKLKTATFIVDSKGKVKLPTWLDEIKLNINGTDYSMGIGGLHSCESNRALHSDDDYVLVDFDVASYYPNIIVGSGLYPAAIGPVFLTVAKNIIVDRVSAKHDAANTELDKYVRATAKVRAEGLKIAANGGLFGKLGSIWSSMFAPHLLIATTLTGQLALLMLVDEAEHRGIHVVSANTDGVVFRIPRVMMGEVVKTRVTDGPVKELIEWWEGHTGFTMEATPYRSIYNANVNNYIAIKDDGKVKLKGTISNPWRENDMRGMLMKNPQMTIVSEAVVDYLTKGTPIEDTINRATDVRKFVTVVNVKGGGVWGKKVHETKTWHEPWTDNYHPMDVVTDVSNSLYLGKVVRYYWSNYGSPIFYKNPDERTGNYKKVSRTDGCRPLMELPEDNAIPSDINRAAYIEAAKEVLMDYGAQDRPPPLKPIRIFKYNAISWFALAI